MKNVNVTSMYLIIHRDRIYKLLNKLLNKFGFINATCKEMNNSNTQCVLKRICLYETIKIARDKVNDIHNSLREVSYFLFSPLPRDSIKSSCTCTCAFFVFNSSTTTTRVSLFIDFHFLLFAVVSRNCETIDLLSTRTRYVLRYRG